METRHDAADPVLCVVSDEYLKAPFSTLERNAAAWQAAQNRPGFVLFVVVRPARFPTLSDHIRRCELWHPCGCGACAMLGAGGESWDQLNAFPKPQFNYIRDIAPVAIINSSPYLLVANVEVPVKAIPEFITYAKAPTVPQVIEDVKVGKLIADYTERWAKVIKFANITPE